MNILMLSEAPFPLDTRVRREAYKLTEHGHKVSIIVPKDKGQSYFEVIKSVRIYRVPRFEWFESGKQLKVSKSSFSSKFSVLLKGLIGYGAEYVYFTTACFCLSFFVLLKDGFDLIHTHNPPDTLFLVAAFYKMFGKKFFYDHHDLCPDLFLEKYGSGRKIIYRILLFLEKVSCRFADVIIATNESYKRIEIERCGAKGENIFVVRYGPDLNELKITEPLPNVRSQAKTILCYLGVVNIQDGVEYLLVTLAKIVHTYTEDICLLVIGDGDDLPRIKELANELMINEHVIFTGYISDRDLLNRYLSSADIFIDAAPYSFLNDNSTFVKHMEYMVYEKPIVSFALKESMFSLKNAGVFIPPNDTEKMAEAIVEIINNPQMRSKLGSNARTRVRQLSWDKVSVPLIQAYENLG